MQLAINTCLHIHRDNRIYLPGLDENIIVILLTMKRMLKWHYRMVYPRISLVNNKKIFILFHHLAIG